MSPRKLKKAGLQAQRWLEQLTVPTDETASLRQLGLALCKGIRNGAGEPMIFGSKSPLLPDLARFIKMSRNEALALAKQIGLSDASKWKVGREQRRFWTQIFGAAALSYAREGDLQVLASLVQAALHLRMNDAWLTDAIVCVLDQQHPKGYFGMLAPESALLGKDDVDLDNARLRLTVESLWALSEFRPRGKAWSGPRLQGIRVSNRTRD